MTLIVSHNPARPDDILIQTPATGRPGVLAAVERARAASRLWALGGATHRAAALHSAAQRVDHAVDELTAQTPGPRPPADNEMWHVTLHAQGPVHVILY